jgi:two-component system, NtrC family, sensor kinase
METRLLALTQLAGPLRLRSLKALSVASVVAPTLVFLAYAAVGYVTHFRNAEARASHLSSILQDHAQRVIEAIDLALRITNERISGLSDEVLREDRKLWEDILKIQAAAPQLGSIFVISANGSLPLTTREFPAPNTEFSDRDYFVAHQEKNEGFFVGQTYVGRISKIPIFNFSIRRNSPDGSFTGVVGSSAQVDYFQNFYASAGDARDRFSVLLLRSDGKVLSRFPSFNVGDVFDISSLEVFAESGRQTAYATSPIDGQKRLFATTKVGNYPVYISYSIPKSAIVSQWSRALVLPAALTVVISVVLLCLSLLALRKAKSESVAIDSLKVTAGTLKTEIERRRSAERSLLQSQKLDAIGQVTGGIAHDFNNLLMIISGNLALMHRGANTPQLKRALDAAQYATTRAASLARQLLAFSRGQSLRPEVVSPVQVLDRAKVWIGRTVTEAVELEFRHDGDVWPIRADVAQLEAALLNLVVNARDAMDGRGHVTIAAHNVVVSGEGSPSSALPTGEYVTLSVTDTGGGMTAEVASKVFEPFFTTKERGKGTGLGLSQVYGFVKQSGGDVAIASEIGMGTTVTMYFPRSAQSPVFDPATPETLDTVRAPGKVVLVVEDDDEVRKLEITMLHDLGYNVLVARSVSEALSILSANGPVDILLTDHVLRGADDGVELGKKATKIRPEISVFLATASLEVASPFPIVKKPFGADDLSKALGGTS